MSEGKRAPKRRTGSVDRRTERSPTVTDRFVDAAIRRLLRYRPSVPHRSPVALVAIAVGLAVLALGQPILDPEPIGVSLVEILVPCSGAVVVAAAARWTTRIDRGAEKHASAVIVSLVFMAISVGTVGIILVTQLPMNVTGFDYPFAVVTALVAGAVVGTPTGFVFDEVIARQDALEEEYHETTRLNQRLQVLNRVLRHNVRNELTVALGGLEHVDDGLGATADGTDAREWLDRSADALERLLDHAEKLLQIESLERSAGDRMTVDLADYVEGYLRTNDLDTDGISIETDFAESAPIRAHPLAGTVVVETIENAIVHNDSDGLSITVRIVAEDDAVEVVVVDTGEGVPDIELAALDRGEESPLVHGRGVGLWLVKWVCTASDGAFAVEENTPAGTVVRVRLPRA
ncbi:MAG: sensor histidine kinase [Haloferacaceae archaeon]